jgi:hypothetical protein
VNANTHATLGRGGAHYVMAVSACCAPADRAVTPGGGATVANGGFRGVGDPRISQLYYIIILLACKSTSARKSLRQDRYARTAGAFSF